MIHYDLVYANARSWQWWRAAGADYKDGLLREYGGDDGSEGAVRSSKLLWALGNYSRFIRPGAVRLNIVAAERLRQTGDRRLNYCDAATDPVGLMVSAYRNAGGQLVVVAINYAQKAKNMKLILKGAMQKGQDVKRWKMYRTSDNNDEHITPVGTVHTGKNMWRYPEEVSLLLQQNDIFIRKAASISTTLNVLISCSRQDLYTFVSIS